ncbi:OmpA family protein [Paraburkholderia caballeronis]|uniref:OmpA family protein n=1 Tax=Paraburkholderia caballeronis TaxID=416943 RepID=UPI00115FB059|nr:OmpA family protein [Paraburkholderia caballeronis]
MDSTDSYATPKASLRDNVKTLLGVFGGIAGLLLAGTPFNGYGSLDPTRAPIRWLIATVGLIAAVLLIGRSMVLLLRLLKPDLVYASVLREHVDLTGYAPADLEEVGWLRAEFKLHRKDVLPDDAPTLDDLEKKADSAYNKWENSREVQRQDNAPANIDGRVAGDRQAYDDRASSLQSVNDWAAFTRMHYRVVKGCNEAFVLGFLALLAIGVFSWAIGQKKDAPPQIFVVPPVPVPPPSPPVLPPVAALPDLRPILFETGKAELLVDGLAELAKARDYLRGHPETGLLALAYTDTRGGRMFNRALAARRAEAVRSALIAEGGIAASRLFVAELPQTDLPTLTGQAVDSQSNRSVHLMLLTLPVRGR